ncbi:MAG: hypothetical protein IJD91_03195 [Clostridia bacterium]|nr:hypothetical protein [Clostridia bacterium]
MSKFNSCSCSRGFDCSFLAIAASVIVGIVTTLLRITAVITLTPAFLWVLLGIAVVYLAVNLIVSSTLRCCRSRDCAQTPLSLVLTGILGTILTAIILLGVIFPATSVLGAIITGALLLFFSLFITATACLVVCLATTDNFNDDIC